MLKYAGMKKLLTITFLLLFGSIMYTVFPSSLSSEQIRFVIPLEAKAEDTVNRLNKEGFIRSPRMFNIIAILMKFPGTIEPGAYNLSKNMTVVSVAYTLLY